MKISISIMAHPSRQKYFNYLTEKLGDVPFAIDYESKGEWENCKAAWRLHDPTAEWHVVIQDDAIICNDFYKRAEEVIVKAKEILQADDYVCNFYYGKRMSALKEASDALKKGYWINGYPKWGVAICMQTKFIEEMIAMGDLLGHLGLGTKDDARIAKFIGSKKMMVYFPMPSIVNHRHGKSLVGDPGEGRSAYKFIDD